MKRIAGTFRPALLAALLAAGGVRAVSPRPVAVVFDDAFTLPEVAFSDARAQTVKLLARLPADRPGALYVTGKPGSRPADYGASPPDLAAAAAGLERRAGEGGLLEALQKAWGEGVARYPDAGGDLILVSDGRSGLDPAQFPAVVEQFARSRWRIHALGVGAPDRKLLEQLCGMTGGDYRDAGEAGVAALADTLALPVATAAVAGSAPSAGSPPAGRGAGGGGRTAALVVALGALALGVAVFFMRGEGSKKAPASADGAAVSDEYKVRAGEPPGKIELVGKTGPKRGMTIAVNADKGLVMGRSRSCDLIIADGLLSGQHLKITCKEGRFYVDDLRSTNGTFLNASRILSAELRPGDLLKLGASEFLIKGAGARDGGKAA